MCPSYPATREEKDSTRGRARVLQEMLAPGGPVRGLALPGGARGAGPVPVLQGLRLGLPHRRRHGLLQGRGAAPDLPAPAAARASHYTLGRLPRWADLAARAPRLVNAVLARGSGGALAKLGGRGGPAPRAAAVRRRDLPAAVGRPRPRRTRRRRARWRCGSTRSPTTSPPRSAHGGRAGAGGRRLPRAGPGRGRLLRADLDLHRPAGRRPARSSAGTVAAASPGCVDAGVPIVGLEPSCTAVLRGDAVELRRRPGRRAGRAGPPAPWPSC